MKIKILLLLAAVIVSTTCISKCLEQKCLPEIQACVAEQTCNDLINACADGGCVDFDTNLINWNCLATCIAPKKNALANNIVICGRKNCPDGLPPMAAHNLAAQN